MNARNIMLRGNKLFLHKARKQAKLDHDVTSQNNNFLGDQAKCHR